MKKNDPYFLSLKHLENDLISNDVGLISQAIFELTRRTETKKSIKEKILFHLLNSNNIHVVQVAMDYFSECGIKSLNGKKIGDIMVEILIDKTKPLGLRDTAAYGVNLLRHKQALPVLKNILTEEEELLTHFPTLKRNINEAIFNLERYK